MVASAIWTRVWIVCWRSPGPGTSRKLSGKNVEQVPALTLESTPSEATR